MAADADRHLLFGLLALQNGLVDQGQLVAAFQAWTRDKSRPLADHLLDRGDLEPDDRSAVAAMVDRHLKKHGADPEKSLASIPAGSSTREKLQALEDPDLLATLAHLASGSPEADPDATASYSVGTSTTDGLRFRVLRPHARGGLGAVFVALDGELNREVALKQILDHHADDPTSRHRFLVEAEITGGLEHPGIVPVYGLGTYTDGRPYYAMRFIRGDSLKDAIATFHADGSLRADPGRRSLALRTLLRRFLDVCNAIEYAHSRGVLHRDIKPGNIIVGKHGETLVVDWGLAKSLGHTEGAEPTEERTLIPSSASGSAETLPGAAIGTPSYMSPEQARGDLNTLGPRSDVYSLGATLYALLTGRAPLQDDDIGVILHKVQRGEFPPPRQLDPAIAPPLGAICLKAMALDPSHRYPSSRALADDLDCWLADEPVDAYPEPWTRTLSRWVARHRTAVTGSAAALLVGLIGLGAVATVQTRARVDLDHKNTELTRANAQLAESNTALDLQRQRAEDREEQAIDAVKRFRDAVADNPVLKNSPELEDLRKTLLKEPLAFFQSLRERLQAENDTRPESLAQLAEAIHDYAHLTDEIGDPRDGLKAHDDSLAIWEQLARAEPGNPNHQSGLATIQNCRGNFLHATGDVESARRAYESSLAIRSRLAQDHPTVTAYRRDLAASHDSLGILLGATGDLESARRAYESSLTIFQRLAEEHPAVTEYQRALAIIHNKLGILLRDTGDVESARRSFESALAIRRRLAEEHPTVTTYQADLAASHGNLGIVLRVTGDVESARRSYESSLAIFQRLAEEHPAVTAYRRDLAASHDSLGILLGTTGDVESARRSYESSLAIRRRLAEEHPGFPEHASNLGGTLNNLAMLDLDAGRFAEARDRLREAVTWQKTALAANPRNPTYRQFLRNHGTNLRWAAQGLDDAELLAEADRGLAELQANDPEFQALEARLAAVLEGADPNDNAEQLALAQHAFNTLRFAAAARLWAEALNDDPTPAADRQAQHAYNAACAAALAAAGQGTDAPDDDAREQLRHRVLGWLRDELDTWSALIESAEEPHAESIAATLRHWQADPDLDSIREPDALARLPESERAAFEALWDEVAALLVQAGTETSPLPDDLFAR